ncbi:MAG: amidohydrolase family protein [Candidatus Pacebacteria bacterium]|nr:amidohydrolase family protein [Candidatus Paceibacterota bacterium]
MTILIKQAQIVDGSGKKPFRADILIRDQKISAIGSFPRKKADLTIDALGMIAAPGFIDVNSDSDHHLSLFTYPSQTDFINQGVTTIIGGQCGASLAPLMYGSLASIREWAYSDSVNVDWRTIKELFAVLNKIKLKVRFETLAGHLTIRNDIVGNDSRDLTDSEMQVFNKVLEEALNQGALGMSTSLGSIYGKNTSFSEIKDLIKLVAKKNKVYTTHLRNEKEDLVKSVKETISMAHETGAKTIISHFRPIAGYENNFREALELIDKSLTDANIYFDANPFDISLLPIYALLPSWAQTQGPEAALKYLDDPNIKSRLIKEMAGLQLGELTVVDAEKQGHLAGKNLEELAKNRSENIVEFVMNLMRTTKFRTILAAQNIDYPLLMDMLFHPRALIGSNGASMPDSPGRVKLERATSTFIKFIEIARERNIPIEDAVKRITFIPAQIFGLSGRGMIREGYAADIVLLKDFKVNQVVINGNIANV